ncbi:hypothetical protein A9255_15105 [Xenorhabdus hominickii]|uniref:DNA damage-inducible protein D n=1 Tax=Xenorhabdus hominickii TaxID=351679 RepID=A0A2G0QEZ2_XENHO|nr:hypothetical protein A9255_15105 [Xenorhabdus hominickii]PHM57729.1 DNA damage-inducible protein D [Xenorhabdus hominickii]
MKVDNKEILLTRQQMDALRKIQQDEYNRSELGIKTRRQELADDAAFKRLREDEKRLFLRNELKEHNKQLVETAQRAGVETNIDFAIFQNHGYQGLYGGLDQKAIHQRKASNN